MIESSSSTDRVPSQNCCLPCPDPDPDPDPDPRTTLILTQAQPPTDKRRNCDRHPHRSPDPSNAPVHCRRRDQQIYEQRIGADGAPSEPKRVTDPDAKLRFADGVVDASRKRLIAVQEDHSGEGEAVNTVSAVGARQTAGILRRPVIAGLS